MKNYFRISWRVLPPIINFIILLALVTIFPNNDFQLCIFAFNISQSVIGIYDYPHYFLSRLKIKTKTNLEDSINFFKYLTFIFLVLITIFSIFNSYIYLNYFIVGFILLAISYERTKKIYFVEKNQDNKKLLSIVTIRALQNICLYFFYFSIYFYESYIVLIQIFLLIFWIIDTNIIKIISQVSYKNSKIYLKNIMFKAIFLALLAMSYMQFDRLFILQNYSQNQVQLINYLYLIIGSFMFIANMFSAGYSINKSITKPHIYQYFLASLSIFIIYFSLNISESINVVLILLLPNILISFDLVRLFSLQINGLFKTQVVGYSLILFLKILSLLFLSNKDLINFYVYLSISLPIYFLVFNKSVKK